MAKKTVDREIGEIHTKVDMILAHITRDTARIDQLEAAEHRRAGKNSIIAIISGFAASLFSSFFIK